MIHEINVLHRTNKRFYCGRRRSVKTQLESRVNGKVINRKSPFEAINKAFAQLVDSRVLQLDLITSKLEEHSNL